MGHQYFRSPSLCVLMAVLYFLVISYCISMRTVLYHNITRDDPKTSGAMSVLATVVSLAMRQDQSEWSTEPQKLAAPRNSTNKDTLDVLVFFPIYGRVQDGHPNKNMDIERFLIEAWASVADSSSMMSSFRLSLRVIAMAEAQEHCYPEFEDKLSTSFSCVALPLGCRHPEFHIPTMDCIFSTAMELASPSELLFYSNGDIIFQPDILSVVSSIFEQLKDPKIVVVGQRTDIPEDSLPPMFSIPALQNLTTHARREGIRYTPYGLDYFIFRPQIFPPAFPHYLLGRWRWDNALMTAFVSRNDVVTGRCTFVEQSESQHKTTTPLKIAHPTVDATETILAIHIGYTTDLSDAHFTSRIGSDYNNNLVQQQWGDTYAMGHIGNTKYVHVPGNFSSYNLISRTSIAAAVA